MLVSFSLLHAQVPLPAEAKDGIFMGNFKIFVHDKEELEELVTRLKSLNGIQTVDRFDTEN